MKLSKWCLLGSLLAATTVAAQEAARPVPLDGSMLITEGGEGERYWELVTKVRPPNYPMAAVRRQVSGCVNIGFVIQSDGTTADFRVLKSVTDAAPGQRDAMVAEFANASIRMIRKFRYAPGPENPGRKPQFSAMSTANSIGTGFTETCEIPNLKQFLEAAAAVDPSADAKL